MKKTIKAWAVLDKKGNFDGSCIFITKQECKYHLWEGDRIVRVTVTVDK